MINDLLFITLGLPAIIVTAGLITGVIASFWVLVILTITGGKPK